MSFELMLKRRILLVLLTTPLLAADTDWIARLGGGSNATPQAGLSR